LAAAPQSRPSATESSASWASRGHFTMRSIDMWRTSEPLPTS
jgi:hypothetical protein